MHVCECGYIFNNPDMYIERHGLDNPPYEGNEHCPKCNSTSFREMERCEQCAECGKKFEPYGKEEFCESCIEDAVNGFTVDLGVAFITYGHKDKVKAEKKFYLECLHGVDSCNDINSLLKAVKASLPNFFEDTLRGYCFEDKLEWARFYYPFICKIELKEIA